MIMSNPNSTTTHGHEEWLGGSPKAIDSPSACSLTVNGLDGKPCHTMRWSLRRDAGLKTPRDRVGADARRRVGTRLKSGPRASVLYTGGTGSTPVRRMSPIATTNGQPPLGDGLADKRVVVTGGAAGIGRATVARFAQAGARVVIVDRNAGEAGGVLEGDERITTIQADVSSPSSVTEAFAEVDDLLGGVDVLIANAGISIRSPALEIPSPDWRAVLGTNLDGVFFCAQEAARRQVVDRGGAILMTASTNGLSGHVNYASYNASKAGVIALTRTLALELAPRIRVNSICPGYVLTAMQEAEYSREMMDQIDGSLPLKRHATPDEIARLFVFLASDHGAYITGQAFVIDGGELA